MILVYLGNLKAKSKENMSTKLTYLVKTFIRAFFTIKPAIWGLWDEWIFLSVSKIELSDAIWTIKVLYFGSNTAAINSFFLTNSIYLVVGKTF